jgi:two-component system, NtrC family, response regulator AtoC
MFDAGMEQPFDILVIGGDEQALEVIKKGCAQRGHVAKLAHSGAEGLKVHRDEGAELVIVQLPVPDMPGSTLMRQLRGQDPRITMVAAGKDQTVQGAPDALQLGAVEYLPEPARDPHELLSIIGVALGARKTDAQLRYLRKKDASEAEWQTIVGQCQAMRKVFAVVRQVCQRTAIGGTPIILITGETGTGKGMIAKSIHYNSARRSRAYVDVNCAAIPATLLESEIFGHERGAFTDARAARAGLFETADGGTLFLDEIGTLPPDLQAKLLTVIEEKRVRRLGGGVPKKVDVQVIAATNRDLIAMVRRGEFREDLYHRLNVVSIVLPPLRERNGDKVLLANAFLRSMCQEYGLPERKLSEEAKQAISQYSWPGNVRELRNAIERIVMLEEDDVVQPEHFTFTTHAAPKPTMEIGVEAGGALRVSLPEHGFSLEALEREILRQALERCGGNVSHAARYLAISRQTMIYRMKKFQLGDPGLADESADPGGSGPRPNPLRGRLSTPIPNEPDDR